jgi:plastocyanin
MHRLSLLLLLSLCTAGGLTAAGSLTFTVKTAKGELLADAVVSLTPLDHTPALVPATDTVIAQEDKEYDPYVTPILAGTRVSFPNRDNIQHHLYSLSKPKRFEKPLYASGAEESIVFDQPGIVTLGCNIHDWMVAYVVILNTPWFAKTGPDGTAALTEIPAGRYRLEVWHPRLGKPAPREITLTTGANPAQEFSLTLKPDRRIRRAPESRTSGY